jgi:glycosyltransferase involved in cell wall biosynthesis
MPDATSTPSLAQPDEPTLSVVVPVHNEAACLPRFHARLSEALSAIGATWEVVYVNDGSTDGTATVLRALCRRDTRAACLALSRNFGKEIALTAGLDRARGAAVVVIDADLQDPPEVIPDLVAAWRGGADMVCARRRIRAGDSRLKRLTAAGFYRLMRRVGHVRLPEDVGDFRLMSRRVVEAVLQFREQHRFMKGLFAWVGFPTATVLYDRAPRAAGTTTWGWWKLWNFALDGITGFTVVPLKVATYLGLLVAACAGLYAAEVVVKTLILGNTVAGYPSLMTVTLLLGGVQLMTLGVIGEYLGRVFNETKRRPLYIVESWVPARPGLVSASS